MSRSRKFFHAVWSGYLLTILMSAQSLITYPIGLAYLGKDGFGLWSAVAQVILFAGFFDLGVGPSLSRFLIDFKDDPANGAYGNFLKSVFFVGIWQSFFFCILALILIPHLPDFMRIVPEQRNIFVHLLFWQIVPTALNFALRPFGLLLYAHQQIAKLNGCSFAAVLANTGTLILGFKGGLGIYAYVAAAWVSFLVLQSGTVFYVWKLHLLPAMTEAKISLRALKPMAAFSSNIFLIALGAKLVEFVPALLVTRHLGVAVFADWMIGTRLIFFVSQIAGRIPNSAEPVFWEMFKRHETGRLRARWIQLVLIAGSIVAFLGGGAVAINPTFVRLWTSSRVVWFTKTDLLLSLWATLLVASTCLNMAPGITKRLGIMKFVYFFEGAALMSVVYFPFIHLQAQWQVILILILGVSLSRLPYGCFRTSKDLEISSALLSKTLARVFGVALLLGSFALILRHATASLNLITQLAVNGALYSICGAVVIYFISLPAEMHERLREICKRFFRKPVYSSKTSE